MNLLNIVDVQLVRLECGECHVVFAVPQYLDQQARETKRSWWCPNGYQRHYITSEVEKLEKKLAAEQAAHARTLGNLTNARAAAHHLSRTNVALRGHTTRLKKRIGAGRCPCCHETFPALSAHIAAEHPGFATEPTP